MTKRNILCPCCLAPLVVTHQGRYEDISDHVSNPNGTPSMKDGYQCLNADWCFASMYKCTWLEDGDFFCGTPPAGMNFGDIRDILDKHWKFKTKTYAVNSWNFFYQTGQIEIKKRIKIFTIGKYVIKFYPREKGYEYPDNEQYMPSRFAYKMEIMMETGDVCYKYIISDYTMIKHTIADFMENYKSSFNRKIPEYSSNSNIDKCLEQIRGYSRSGYSDTRRYKRISKHLINILFPVKVRRIKNLAKEQKRFF